MILNGFIFKKLNQIKILKRNQNPGSRLEVACCLLNSTVNPAHFQQKIFYYFKFETNARAFLTLNISANRIVRYHPYVTSAKGIGGCIVNADIVGGS